MNAEFMREKKLGIVGIQGLPARYGAFEQTVDQLVKYSFMNSLPFKFYVGCAKKSKIEKYDQPNVVRVFAKRKNGPYVIIYQLVIFFKLYSLGVRSFVFFGYTLSPFFNLMIKMGCNILCNVDGFEWRRAKWDRAAKKYFKICEYMAARSGADLIFDSIGVARYYNIHFGKKGTLAFYGTKDLDVKVQNQSMQHVEIDNYALTIMRLEPENNIETIVKAFSATPDQTLIIVGPSTKYFDDYIKPIVARSVNIIYRGPIYDRSELDRIRRAAKFYVHGHSVGGTNPTLLEAVQAKRPIVAYSSIFNKEVLRNYGSYFHGVQDLIHIIKNKVYQDLAPPNLSEDYSWASVCHKYLVFFEG